MTQRDRAARSTARRAARVRAGFAAALLHASCAGLAAAAGGIDAPDAYAGTWQVEITRSGTASGSAHTQRSTIRNECWRSAEFHVCHQSIDGKSGALLVFAYDAGNKSYWTYPVAAGADSVQRGRLIIEGNVWTYPWQQVTHGETTYFRVVNIFTSPDTIEFREEHSLDNSHWTRTASGLEHRIHTAAGR